MRTSVRRKSLGHMARRITPFCSGECDTPCQTRPPTRLSLNENETVAWALRHDGFGNCRRIRRLLRPSVVRGERSPRLTVEVAHHARLSRVGILAGVRDGAGITQYSRRPSRSVTDHQHCHTAKHGIDDDHEDNESDA